MIGPDERRYVTRQVWWTCGAVVLALWVALPLVYVLLYITLSMAGLMMSSRPFGPVIGVPVLVIGVGAASLLEYAAALLAAEAMRHYRRGLHDLPVRRVARGAVAGLILGVVAVQLLDAWERDLRALGVPDHAGFALSVGALIAAPLAGAALGIRAWANMKTSESGKGGSGLELADGRH